MTPLYCHMDSCLSCRLLNNFYIVPLASVVTVVRVFAFQDLPEQDHLIIKIDNVPIMFLLSTPSVYITGQSLYYLLNTNISTRLCDSLGTEK